MTDYATLLNHSGLKATFQRVTLLENIEKYGHISIDKLYKEVIKKYPSLSLATVYKNIILMVEKSVLTQVPIEGKKPKYELVKKEHIHLICTECGEVEDREYTPSANALFSTMSKEEHFSLHKPQVNLYGVCQSCQEVNTSFER